MDTQIRQLFLGLEVHAPWGDVFPRGRLIAPEHRHLTLAFLGRQSLPDLLEKLDSFPALPFELAPVGEFDRVLFLPKRQPKVVAWHVQWWDEADAVAGFRTDCVTWLRQQGYAVDERPFLPHMTIARGHFSPRQWREAFHPLPFYTPALHLYESLGYSKYRCVKSFFFRPPFEEIEHTADLAFHVYGETKEQLFVHAQAALAFAYPELVRYRTAVETVDSFEGIVRELNRMLQRMDVDQGCPLKAVTYSGEITEDNGVLSWEMIIDV